MRLSAAQGYDVAQRSLALRYATGTGGTEQDYVIAHMWFNLATINGNEWTFEEKANLERSMSTDQVTRANELARTCIDTGYVDCGQRNIR